MSKVKIDEYKRKYYDVEVELDLSAVATKRIYIDEINQYRNDMNENMLKHYGIDEHYEHKDEFNEPNRMLAEDLAKDEIEEEDYINEIEVQNMSVIRDPDAGMETTKGDIWRCVYCKQHFTGWGNNPETIGKLRFDLDDKCCDTCNTNHVIPARLSDIINNKNLKEVI